MSRAEEKVEHWEASRFVIWILRRRGREEDLHIPVSSTSRTDSWPECKEHAFVNIGQTRMRIVEMMHTSRKS